MTDESIIDVVCIGAGPGGLSVKLWCDDLRLSCAVIERASETGGQLHNIHNRVENYLGLTAANGAELLRHFWSKIPESSIRVGQEAVSILPDDLSITVGETHRIEARSIIIATGVRRRRIGVPGEEEFAGRGLLVSGAKSLNDVAGRRVVIIGGGDAAVENALMLAPTAERVTLIHRGAHLSARPDFLARLETTRNIDLRLNTTLERISGDQAVERVTVADNGSGSTETIPAERVLIRIGFEPNNEIAQTLGIIGRDGYIRTDELCETSIRQIFAIGDIRRPRTQTISGAVGDAATAVKTIAHRLVRRPD